MIGPQKTAYLSVATLRPDGGLGALGPAGVLRGATPDVDLGCLF
jgi:hypothetical protein